MKLSEQTERVASRLSTMALPARLMPIVVSTLPGGITDATLNLLARAIQQWVAIDRLRHHGIVPVPLADAWRNDGGDPGELERLRLAFRYRSARQAVSPYAPLGRAPSEMHQAAEVLRSFWITTGHDVLELDRFMAGVDAEFTDVFPG